MAFDCTDFNISPEQRFFIKLSDIGTQMRVRLHNTLADAQGDANIVGTADADFGTDVKIVLTAGAAMPSSGDPLAKFNPALDYHLKVTGADGDATVIQAIGPFTDLAPIEDPLMLTEQVIQDRAQVEVNRGTHLSVIRRLQLSDHKPTLDEAQIISFSSTKRSISNEKMRIMEVVTECSIQQTREVVFFDSIVTLRYEDYKRV